VLFGLESGVLTLPPWVVQLEFIMKTRLSDSGFQNEKGKVAFSICWLF
jgi:hypothetical protein